MQPEIEYLKAKLFRLTCLQYLTEYWWLFSSFPNSSESVSFFSLFNINSNVASSSLSTRIYSPSKSLCKKRLKFLTCKKAVLYLVDGYDEARCAFPITDKPLQYSINYTKIYFLSSFAPHWKFRFSCFFMLMWKLIFFRFNQITCKRISFVMPEIIVNRFYGFPNYHEIIGLFFSFFRYLFMFKNNFPFFLFLFRESEKHTTNQTTQWHSQTSTEHFFWSKSFVNTSQTGKQIGATRETKWKLESSGKFSESEFRFVLIFRYDILSDLLIEDHWALVFEVWKLKILLSLWKSIDLIDIFNENCLDLLPTLRTDF